jgi:hypothetical protein
MRSLPGPRVTEPCAWFTMFSLGVTESKDS